MGTDYAGYYKIQSDMLRELTETEERNLWNELAKERKRKIEIMHSRVTFNLSAELNWNRNHAPTPVFLLRLKKPILPERWRGPREGWIQWSELLINPGIKIKGMPDLQGEPLTAQMVYDAIQKLGENWRLK